MSSNSDDENNLNDPLFKERAKAKSLISLVLSENYLNNNEIKIYDPLKHGDIIIINAEIIKKKLSKRIKLSIKKKIDK